jgi:PKD repeat protein
VGDSISQAASTGGSLGADYPQNSWSTGTNSTVNSHYLRLLALGAPISGQNNNLPVSGAKAAGLNAQMINVAAIDPAYLTVQIGGNDLCTDAFAQMTPVTDFRAQFQTAMTTLTSGSPNTNVFVASIPDAYQLWSLFKGSGWARFIWSIGGVCQSLLANPTSTLQVDVQRRLDVQLRNIAYNTQLREVCAAFTKCRFDNNAVFNTQFTTSDIAGDYFHPSIAGQAKLSSVSWAAGYAWATSPPPPNAAPTASFTTSCTGLTCTFTDASTDSDGSIAGRSWTFGDGSPESTATNPSHTYTATGTYNVALTVTDNDGATGTTTSAVAVTSPPAAQQMWVGDLSATTAPAGRSGWTATVTIQVAPAAGAVAGVTVTGTWSAGSGATTCTTDATGKCSVKSSTLNKKTTSVTFSVTNMTRSGWTYTSDENVVTSIPVAKPLT